MCVRTRIERDVMIVRAADARPGAAGALPKEWGVVRVEYEAHGQDLSEVAGVVENKADGPDQDRDARFSEAKVVDWTGTDFRPIWHFPSSLKRWLSE